MSVDFQWQEMEETVPLGNVPAVCQVKTQAKQPTLIYAMPEPARPVPPRLWSAVLLATLVLVLGAYGSLKWRAHQGWLAARNDLQAVAEAEYRALRQGHADLFYTFQAENHPSSTRYAMERDWINSLVSPPDTLQITSLDLRDGRATLHLGYEAGGLPHERVQAYVRADNGWRRTSPGLNFWGERRTLRTSHFRIRYHAAEDAVVPQVARWAEALYANLDFGAAAPARQPYITIELQAEDLPSTFSLRDRRFSLRSPLLSGVPVSRETGPLPVEGLESLTYAADAGREILTDTASSFIAPMAYRIALIRATDVTGSCASPLSDSPWLLAVAAVEHEVETLLPQVDYHGTSAATGQGMAADGGLLPLETLIASCYDLSGQELQPAKLIPDEMLSHVCEPVKYYDPVLAPSPSGPLWPPCPLYPQPDAELALAQIKSLIAFAEERSRDTQPSVIQRWLQFLEDVRGWGYSYHDYFIYRRPVGPAPALPESYRAAFPPNPDAFVATWQAWLRR